METSQRGHRRWLVPEGRPNSPGGDVYLSDRRRDPTAFGPMAGGDRRLEKKRAACVLIGDLISAPITRCGSKLSTRIKAPSLRASMLPWPPPTKGSCGSAAEAWRKYRGVNIEKEASSAEFRLLEDALREKEQSPLPPHWLPFFSCAAGPRSCTIGRATWPRGSRRGQTAASSGVEQLLRREQDQGLHDAIKWFLELERRGLPQTAEALGHAARQVRELLEFASPEPPERQRLMKLRERLERALTVFRPGGSAPPLSGQWTR